MRALRQIPWWWWIASTGCGLTHAYAAPFSTTFMTASDARFAEVVALHFEQAKACWGQKRLPSPGLMRNETLGIIAAQERFWPGRTEYRERLLAMILAEGAGLSGGNPDDPSYGVAHVNELTARFACWYFRIDAPPSKKALIARLQDDSRFCILVSAAILAMGEWQFGGDWLRSVGAYRYGTEGFKQLVRNKPDRPITDLPGIKGYVRVLEWTMCLTAYVQTDTPMSNCRCLPGTR